MTLIIAVRYSIYGALYCSLGVTPPLNTQVEMPFDALEADTSNHHLVTDTLNKERVLVIPEVW